MARKRTTGGRTTPKGTKSPAKKQARTQPDAAGPPVGHGKAVTKKADKSRQWVSRPETHNRGNR